MNNGILYRYARWIYRNATAIVIGSIILAAASIVGSALYLKTQTGILDLYSEKNEINRRFFEYSRKFGAVESLIIVFEGPDEARRRDAAQALADRLKANPQGYIKDIFYKVDLNLFKRHALQFMDEAQTEAMLKEVQEPGGGIRRLFASRDLPAFFDFVNESLEDGLKKGAAPQGDAAEQFGKLLQPLLLLRESLEGKTIDADVMASRLEGANKRASNLDEHGFLRTDDQTMHVMMITPVDSKQDYKLAAKLVDWVRAEINPVEKQFGDVTIGVTGGPALNDDQFRISERDMTLASIFAFISTAILFFLAFKSFVRPFLGIFTLVLNIAMVFGLTTLVIGHLNLFSLAFVVILVGQGTYYGVHVIARYEEELQKGLSVDVAMQETLAHVFGNVTTGAATTAAAFFATTLVDLKGFAELGWIAGGGIVLSAISMQLILPAMLVLYDRRRPRDKLFIPDRVNSARMGKFSSMVLRHIRTYANVGAVVITVLGAGGAYFFFSPNHGITFDNNLLNLQAKNTEAVQYEKKLIHTSLSPRAGIYMTGNVEDAKRIADAARARPTVQRVEWLGDVFPESAADPGLRRTLRADLLALPQPEPLPPSPEALKTSLTRLKANLEKVENQALGAAQGERFLEAAGQGIAAVDGILAALAAEGGSAAGRLDDFQKTFFQSTRGLLRDAAETEPLTIAQLPQELRDRFLSGDGTYAIYAFPSVNIWEQEPLGAFVGDLRAVRSDVTGPPVMFLEILRLVKKDYFRAAFFSAVAIFLIFLIDFRSLGYALLASAPLVLGVFSLFGGMSIFGLTFNTANMIALPMILGIGADNGVHMIHRFREEIDGDLSFLFKSTGKALLITYLDSITSFIGLAFASHQGLAQMGKVVILGLTTCTLAGFLFLPAVMLWIQRRRRSRSLTPQAAGSTN